MKLAIVGSTVLEDSEALVKLAVSLWFTKLKATCIVSGAAMGVDRIAAETARLMGLEVIEFPPKTNNWEGYKERNMLIAKECDKLLRIVSKRSTTYGSGWTRDRAKELGKPVFEIELP